MSLIMAFGIGLAIGVVIHVAQPDREPDNFLVTLLLGVAGAIMGWLIGGAYGWFARGVWAAALTAALGALAVIAVQRWMARATRLP